MVSMDVRPRLYDAVIAEHLAVHRQMLFITGPRQVGKTTTCRRHADGYLNWDNFDEREIILAGPSRLAEWLGLDSLADSLPVVLFDELHKFPRWKQLLKGFFDTYSERVKVMVTGSSHFDLYRSGGDSLMGRYFVYRMHPFSVAEVIDPSPPPANEVVRPPAPIDDDEFEALWRYGGYPEPFLKRSDRFSRRWQALRFDALVRQDVRDISRVQHLGQLQTMARLLAAESPLRVVFDRLARRLRVSIDTVRNWLDLLCRLHLGFLLRPWYKNVARSLRKEPRWLLRDWSALEDPGQRAETFVGCHLLKAVEGWTDLGLGRFELCYLRDKDKREVDFVVIRDGEPWFLVEVKLRGGRPSPSLEHFQGALGAPFAFLVEVEGRHVDADCFARPGGPLIVPARTFLSQLL